MVLADLALGAGVIAARERILLHRPGSLVSHIDTKGVKENLSDDYD